MISTEEASELILTNLPNLGQEQVRLDNCLGRQTIEDIYSPEDSPLFDNSGMDGFAVFGNDVKSVDKNNFIKLNILGESSAGLPYIGKPQTGCAIKISTGAMVPNKFDTIIPIENCEIKGNEVLVKSVSKVGQHIRKQGDEFRSSDLLVEANTFIDPSTIALLSLVGINSINCKRLPKVAVITTGSELVKSDVVLKAGQIRDANTPMLNNLLKLSGIKDVLKFHVDDSLNNTITVIDKASSQADIIIFSGGVSVGSHDHVKQASKIAGFNEIFWKINQKPGKPMFFSKREKVILFGLPGNSVSALMNFVKYIIPALNKLCGIGKKEMTLNAKAEADIRNTGSRIELVRVKLELRNDELFFSKLLKQGSHMLTSIANSDGFVSINSQQKISKGELVEVQIFPWKHLSQFIGKAL